MTVEGLDRWFNTFIGAFGGAGIAAGICRPDLAPAPTLIAFGAQLVTLAVCVWLLRFTNGGRR